MSQILREDIVCLQRNGAIRQIEPGNLTKQLEVRKRLDCKSFDWFMKEVAFDQDKYYPAVEPPDGAKGQIENKAHTGFCVSARSTGKDEQVREGIAEKEQSFIHVKDKREKAVRYHCGRRGEKRASYSV